MTDWSNLTEEELEKLALEFLKMERQEFNSLLPDTEQITEE